MPRANHTSNPSPELVRLGAAIRELRLQRGLKQIEVATASGISEAQISQIEKARTNPGWLTLVRVVEVGMGCSMVDLTRVYSAVTNDIERTDS